MAATPEVDSVWIGFMDVIPVIGTVKESVELVLALYEGETGVIREKAKAVENFVKESLKKPVKKSVSGKPAAAATDASDFSGLRNVREVRREQIIEYMAKGSKRETKLTTAQLDQRRRTAQNTIEKNMLDNIHIIDPNFNQELKEQMGRARRGEHVFNNNVLRFHSNVLDAFVQRQNIHALRGYNQGTIADLGRHTLLQNTEIEIRNNMVVHIDVGVPYLNMNAWLYGQRSRFLLEALLAVLGHINPDEETEEERRRVNDNIDNMNQYEIYVDPLAREMWINNARDRRDRLARFNVVRGQVEAMYTDHGLGWCTRVMNVVALWF